MTKKLIMILGLVLSSMLMKAQAFCAFPEDWRQVLAEAGAGGDAQRLYPVGQSLSEETLECHPC